MPIYMDDLPTKAASISRQNSNGVGHQCVVAFEEAKLFFREMEWGHTLFIDLRQILNQMGAQDHYVATLRELAHQCIRRATESQRKDMMTATYALALEATLVNEDVEDLVAILPHRDCEHFLETGEALRVYRIPLWARREISFPSGPIHSVEEISSDRTLQKPEYEGYPYSFPALEGLLRRITDQPVLDLGPVMWKAGHRPELARTFWLLSRDLLRIPSEEWKVIRKEPAKISDLALRSTQIYGLSDPWIWRQGRYRQLLEGVYSNLIECLRNQERFLANQSLAYYVAGIREWYDCYLSEDYVRSLSNMVQAFRAFRQSDTTDENTRPELEFARELIEIGENLTLTERKERMSVRERQLIPSSPPFEMDASLRRTAESHEVIEPLSQPFRQRLNEYKDLHAEWHDMQDDMGRISGDKLSDLLARYKRQKRVAYAPAHELRVLQYAYDDDIERIERLFQAIETGPIVQIKLRNPYVILSLREKLTIEVENVGGETANRFSLELEKSKEFELFSSSSVYVTERLVPGRPWKVELDIVPKQQLLTLCLTYEFENRKGQRGCGEDRLGIEVRPSHRSGTKPTGEALYQPGLPVFGGRFFGREKEIERICDRLRGGISVPILVRGPRRMGKSSLLRQLELILGNPKELRQMNFPAEWESQLSTIRPVFSDLQLISSSTLNYEAEFFRMIFKDICKTLSFECDVVEWTRDFERFAGRAFLEQVRRVLDENPGMRLLIIIDEWDELYRPEYKDLSRNLRSLMGGEYRMNWLISSTWSLSEEMGRWGSPFFNMSLPIELKAIDWESASRIITEPSERIGVIWHGEAVVAALQETGQRPYLIQLVCAKVMDVLRDMNTNVVSTEVVSRVLTQIISEAKDTTVYFGFLWNEDRLTVRDKQTRPAAYVRWLGRLILWVLDENSPQSMEYASIRRAILEEFRHRSLRVPDQAFFEEEFDSQMVLLTWIFDAITQEENEYRISIPLVQRWLKRVMSHHKDMVREAHAGFVQDSKKDKQYA